MHLRVEVNAQGKRKYTCSIYGSPRYPQLCQEFNCVSWAKFNNAYNSQNTALLEAQLAFDKTKKAEDDGSVDNGKDGLFADSVIRDLAEELTPTSPVPISPGFNHDQAPANEQPKSDSRPSMS